MKTAISFTKILIASTLLFVAFVIISRPAGASSTILPVATLSSTSRPSSAFLVDSPTSFNPQPVQPGVGDQNSSPDSDSLLSNPQPLGNLVAIDWQDLNVSGDQAFLADLLDLPSYNESWTQFISRKEGSGAVPNDSPSSYAIQGDIYPSVMLCTAGLRSGQGTDCITCHNPSLASVLFSSVDGSQQYVHSQAGHTPIVDCQVCHIQNDERAYKLIRGVE